jgi:hypothetical protein
LPGDRFDKYSSKPLGFISTENTFPSIGSLVPFPLVNVCADVRLLRTSISSPCFMVILEGLKTSFPSVLFVIEVTAAMGVESRDSDARFCPFA